VTGIMPDWLIRRIVSWITTIHINAIPSREESAFFGRSCVICDKEFDVPPDWAFDRRRAHYCERCRSKVSR
jgi:hypothetical protein